MMYYKNPKLRPSKGGYIVTATKYTLSTGAYDGEKHVGECEEVFKDGGKALARIDEMFKQGTSSTAAKIKMIAKKESNKEPLTHDDDY